MTQEFIVELEEGVWLTDHTEGHDPSRTLIQKNARIFETERSARSAKEFTEVGNAKLNIETKSSSGKAARCYLCNKTMYDQEVIRITPHNRVSSQLCMKCTSELIIALQQLTLELSRAVGAGLNE